jgi:hypothetical protein
MKDKKNHQPTGGIGPLDKWQDDVNNAYADLLISVALEAGFMRGPKIDLGNSWETLMLGLEMSVRPQKEKVIEMIAEAVEAGDLAFARRFAERMWEEFADSVQVKGH